MIQDKMVRRQYRHALNHCYRHKRPHVPSAPSNTTQFIMNDHESVEPDFDLMHNAIMEHYNRNKKRKHQHVTPTSTTAAAATQTTTTTAQIITNNAQNQNPSLSRNLQQQQQTQCNQQQQQSQCNQQHQQLTQIQQPQPLQLQESTKSNPTTPSYRPTSSPGDEDGMSPFINHEHLQSEFQEVYANIHTERLSSMSKNQLVNQYLLLEERVEELENQLRESQTTK